MQTLDRCSGTRWNESARPMTRDRRRPAASPICSPISCCRRDAMVANKHRPPVLAAPRRDRAGACAGRHSASRSIRRNLLRCSRHATVAIDWLKLRLAPPGLRPPSRRSGRASGGDRGACACPAPRPPGSGGLCRPLGLARTGRRRWRYRAGLIATVWAGGYRGRADDARLTSTPTCPRGCRTAAS